MTKRILATLISGGLLGSLMAVMPAVTAGAVDPPDTFPRGDNGGYYMFGPESYSKQPDWMADLPDDTFAGELTIPGTHDSGAITDVLNSQTQTMRIGEQLQAGIRSFDLRYVCKEDENGREFDFQIFHGAVDMDTRMEEVFDKFEEFLDAHPEETLFVSFGNEKDKSGNSGAANEDTCDYPSGEDADSKLVDMQEGYDDLFATDKDWDGLEDHHETALGTSSSDVDSDDDTLIDSDEVYNFDTKPLLADSDGDGTADKDDTVAWYGVQNSQVDTNGDGSRGPSSICPNKCNQQMRLGELRGHVWEIKRNFKDDAGNTNDGKEFVADVIGPDGPDRHGNGRYMVDGWWHTCLDDNHKLHASNCKYTVDQRVEATIRVMDAMAAEGDPLATEINSIDIAGGYFEENYAFFTADMFDSSYHLTLDPYVVAGGHHEFDGQEIVKGLNQQMFERLRADDHDYRGILAMDFPGPGLIDLLIKMNSDLGRLPNRDFPWSSGRWDGANEIPSRASTEVGVIQDEVDGVPVACPHVEKLEIQLDNEDTDNANDSAGWIGSSEVLSGGPTRTVLRFCRADGTKFQDPINGIYAVLRLGTECPAGSEEFYRFLDNEDDIGDTPASGSFTRGAILPSRQLYPPSGTLISMCLFEGTSGGVTQLPDLGFSYGVFGRGLPNVLDGGWIYTDDEDDANANEEGRQGTVWGGQNTMFAFSKVRGIQPEVRVLDPDPAPPVDANSFTFENDEQELLQVDVSAPGGLRPNGSVEIFTLHPDGSRDFVASHRPVVNGTATYDLHELSLHRGVGVYDLQTQFVSSDSRYENRGGPTLTVIITRDNTRPVFTVARPAMNQAYSKAQYDAGCGICGTLAAVPDDPIQTVSWAMQNPEGEWVDEFGGTHASPVFHPSSFVAPTPGAPGSFSFGSLTADELTQGASTPANPFGNGTYSLTLRVLEADGGTTADEVVPFRMETTPPPPPTVSYPPDEGAAPEASHISRSEWGAECPTLGVCGVVDADDLAQVRVRLTRLTDGEFWNAGWRNDFLGTDHFFHTPLADLEPERDADGHLTGRTLWSLEIPVDDLVDTRYQLEVEATDDTGEVGALVQDLSLDPPQSAAFFTFDSTVPEVTISQPEQNEVLGAIADWSDCGPIGTLGICGSLTEYPNLEQRDISLRRVNGTYYDFASGTPQFTSTTEVWKQIDSQVGAIAPDGDFIYFFPADLPEGSYVVSVRAQDEAGNTRILRREFVYDLTAPVVSLAPTHPATATGWYYQAPDWSPVVQDVSKTTCTPTVTSQLSPTLFSVSTTCTDQTGRSTPASTTYNLDRTEPELSVTVTPDRPGSGWWNHGLTVHFVCVDDESGTNGNADVHLTADGADQSRSYTCTNGAGIGVTKTASDLDLDSTGPTFGPEQITPAANVNGWRKVDVVVVRDCIDPLSGPVLPHDTGVITGEGSNLSTTLSCEDEAGNSSEATTSGIKIDRTDPTIGAADVSPGANVFGWRNVDVTVTRTCTDALSGPVDSSVSKVVTGEGAGLFATLTCKDKADNTSTATELGIKIDRTKPTISITRPAGTYTYGQAVNASFSCADALAGIASCVGTVADGAALDTGSVGTKSFTVTASDKAGNTETTTVTYEVVKATPGIAVSVTPSPSTYGQTPVAKVTVTGPLGAPTGTVQLSVNGTNVGGPLTLVDGKAQVALPGLNAGAYSVKAVYSGDTNHEGATKTASHTVNKAPTTLDANPGLLRIKAGPGLTILVTLGPSAKLTENVNGTPVAGRTVVFRSGGTEICRATTNAAGVAGCEGPLQLASVLLGLGYRADFEGDSNLLPSGDDGDLVRVG